jgi:zinc transporter, ZIP family
VSLFDRFLGRLWILGVPLAALIAAVVIVVARPWQSAAEPVVPELSVEQATLRPGAIVLVLANASEEAARVAQVIVSDAYVDFRASRYTVQPNDVERITITYPWVRGESYDIELLLSSGEAVQYEVEKAETGSRSAESAL